MSEMNYYQKQEIEAAKRLREMLTRPMPERADMLGCEGEFDPWDLFPSLYGSYSTEFDKLAIEVLCDIRDGLHRRDDLANEMFREVLCTTGFCNYGTSPRVCFPAKEFEAMLPDLIKRWREYANLAWGEPVTELE